MTLFGSSGIRRIVDREFLELSFRVGLAAGGLYPSVIVGCDTRTTSNAVKHAFLSGLLSAGAAAADAGVAPTPTIAYASRNFDAGAVITASHNPPEYNGIKLVNPDGSAFDAAQRRQIEELVADQSTGVASWDRVNDCTYYGTAIEAHVGRITADFRTDLRLKVVVDCGCGAASGVTPSMLTDLGCEVVRINCEPSGHFPRGIEPTNENLQYVMQRVKSEEADFGIAHDGDADRVVAVDDSGRLIGGDRLMVLLARETGATKVVTTVDASLTIDDLGVEVTRTRVGDAFVSEEMRRIATTDQAAQFGGEPSGCFIFPRVTLCPDGIYAAARIAEIASRSRLSSVVDELPTYPIMRGSIAGDRSVMDRVATKLTGKGWSIDEVDGTRVAFEDGWVLIRPSGTEPTIRITAEARDGQRAAELYRLGVETVKACLEETERAMT